MAKGQGKNAASRAHDEDCGDSRGPQIVRVNVRTKELGPSGGPKRRRRGRPEVGTAKSL
jgi:hypothetical protein